MASEIFSITLSDAEKRLSTITLYKDGTVSFDVTGKLYAKVNDVLNYTETTSKTLVMSIEDAVLFVRSISGMEINDAAVLPASYESKKVSVNIYKNCARIDVDNLAFIADIKEHFLQRLQWAFIAMLKRVTKI